MILRRSKAVQFNALRSLLNYICSLCNKSIEPQQQKHHQQQQQQQQQKQEPSKQENLKTQTKKIAKHYENTNICVDIFTCESCKKSFVLYTNIHTKLVEVKIWSQDRLAVIIIGIVILILGIMLSTIPWLDYFILKNLQLWNDTLSFHYWQRPGVVRLTKVYIYNVTNPDGFLNGEKPRLTEVGPFVYRGYILVEKMLINYKINHIVNEA
ncbi:unnamed protein product [Ceratitis capitata]|uniref:(Mediterranean fruit fly) hypothetical protein n=1 Tax=Ceratitis capitata TaxID=7213 RepID=A0A811UY90_CERCA|nr:unnamed protein product [Ceratitis capitata]